jgi:hypothetical protein
MVVGLGAESRSGRERLETQAQMADEHKQYDERTDELGPGRPVRFLRRPGHMAIGSLHVHRASVPQVGRSPFGAGSRMHGERDLTWSKQCLGTVTVAPGGREKRALTPFPLALCAAGGGGGAVAGNRGLASVLPDENSMPGLPRAPLVAPRPSAQARGVAAEAAPSVPSQMAPSPTSLPVGSLAGLAPPRPAMLG